MINNKPLVSIITVSYNSDQTIEKTIQHVLNQTYTNIEYILIDGKSKDNTMNIVRAYKPLFNKRNISYKYISEKDDGIYYAMNKGLEMCTGELIGIINSDDWYELNAIDKIVDLYLTNKDFDIYHGLLRYIDRTDNPDSIIGHYDSVLNYAMLEHPTCFVKRACYKKIGLFDLKYRSAADYDWMLRAKKFNCKFLLSTDLIANFKRGGMSDSHISVIEKLNIKRRYGLFSMFKWMYLRVYHSVVPLVKKIVNALR